MERGLLFDRSNPAVAYAVERLQWLLDPIPVESFFAEYWEKQPLIVHRKKESYYGDLYSCERLFRSAEKSDLRFGTDVNVCKVHNGRKESMNPGHDVPVKAKALDAYELQKLRKLFEKRKGTLQVHQPHHHTPALASLLSDLEMLFNSLVGVNAYLTHTSAQGLAPHHDDVDVFVLQVEGTKQWFLHAPLSPHPLEPSRDFSISEIGEPTHEVELQPGDLLYMPRGYIHYARTSEKPSTHLTISTYQRNTTGELLRRALELSWIRAMDVSPDMRVGLPIGLMYRVGSGPCSLPFVAGKPMRMAGHEVSRALEFAPSDEHAPLLSDFGSKVTALVDQVQGQVASELNNAADSMAIDFMLSRLPPSPGMLQRIMGQHNYDGKEQRESGDALLNPEAPVARVGPDPGLGGVSIRITDPSHVRLVIERSNPEDKINGDDDDDSDGEDDGADSHQSAVLYCSMNNAVDGHMMGPPNPGPMSVAYFDVWFAPAIAYLIQQYPAFVDPSELPMVLPKDEDNMSSSEDEDEEEDEDEAVQRRVWLAQTLWDIGAVVAEAEGGSSGDDESEDSAADMSPEEFFHSDMSDEFHEWFEDDEEEDESEQEEGGEDEHEGSEDDDDVDVHAIKVGKHKRRRQDSRPKKAGKRRKGNDGGDVKVLHKQRAAGPSSNKDEAIPSSNKTKSKGKNKPKQGQSEPSGQAAKKKAKAAKGDGAQKQQAKQQAKQQKLKKKEQKKQKKRSKRGEGKR